MLRLDTVVLNMDLVTDIQKLNGSTRVFFVTPPGDPDVYYDRDMRSHKDLEGLDETLLHEWLELNAVKAGGPQARQLARWKD